MKKLVMTALALLLCVASAPYALNYIYLSDTELTVFNDRIPFESGDTIGGPVRTNDQFALTHRPVFYDHVIQSADSFLTEDWTKPSPSRSMASPPASPPTMFP